MLQERGIGAIHSDAGDAAIGSHRHAHAGRHRRAEVTGPQLGLARPQQLYRFAGQCCRHARGLQYPVVLQAATKSTAGDLRMDVHLLQRPPESTGQCSTRVALALRSHPNLQQFGRNACRGVERLHRQVGEVRHVEEQVDRFGRTARFPDVRSRFKDLLAHTVQRTGQRVVVLVDEYDKPILDCIEDKDTARQMREVLKDFYAVLKDADEHLKFVFLTGVSKFSKVSLFSGLNNLQDITLDARYSAICGYTDFDVDTVFAAELPGLDRAQIRDWYNGYNWLGESVYNPFGLLQLFDQRHIMPYWFETGTPTFLIKLLQQRQQFTPKLGHLVASASLLSTFDVDNIPVEALMFQAGYLTVDQSWQTPGELEITLKYPNREVKTSLNKSLLQSLSGGPSVQVSRVYKLLQTQDFAGLKDLFHAFYASIANDWYRKNELAGFEGYYASVFYSYLAALGLDINLEDPTSIGRIDMSMHFCGHIYLFEFKVVELTPKGAALQQLKDKGYADKFKASGQPIHLIGVEFSKASRNIVGFEVETLADFGG